MCTVAILFLLFVVLLFVACFLIRDARAADVACTAVLVVMMVLGIVMSIEVLLR